LKEAGIYRSEAVTAPQPFIALAGFFFDQAQLPAAAGALFFRFCQIVHDPFPPQMPRQRLASTPLVVLPALLATLRSAAEILIIGVVLIALAFRMLRLPGGLKQCQLLFGQLLALAAALRFQQLAQQILILVLFRHGAVQLLDQIHHDLPQRVGILRQSFRIDGHSPECKKENLKRPGKT
jgi:hypothetical protein